MIFVLVAPRRHVTMSTLGSLGVTVVGSVLHKAALPMVSTGTTTETGIIKKVHRGIIKILTHGVLMGILVTLTKGTMSQSRTSAKGLEKLLEEEV